MSEIKTIKTPDQSVQSHIFPSVQRNILKDSANSRGKVVLCSYFDENSCNKHVFQAHIGQDLDLSKGAVERGDEQIDEHHSNQHIVAYLRTTTCSGHTKCSL